jgi:TPP-dependent pyruvate/acetoin dehydrogenase alpha subunit
VEAEELIAFEKDIAQIFESGQIKAPVHLHGGNEQYLIDIFKYIKPTDWVCSTHRSHYHALLKGVPPEWVKKEILNGHSITLCNSGYKFITSAIVGGIIPIAVGLAMAGERVWCFVGDMASETGIFHECIKYATGQKLPITFVVEDNGMSVETPTDKVWRYSYQRTFPHQGSGRWVTF